jgi:hypothetical protein
MKSAFIIAGFNQQGITAANCADFEPLKTGLSEKGYQTQPFDLSWNRQTITSYRRRFIEFYTAHHTEDNLIIGNSFGAAIALLSAAALQPNKLILGSLSPFFTEDVGKTSAEDAAIVGPRRLHDFARYSARETAEAIDPSQTETYVLYGQREHETAPELVERCRETAGQIACATLIEIPNAPHNIDDPTYTDAVLALC